MQVLDGFTVEIEKENKYQAAHLFVRGKYVHDILFLGNGSVILRDADQFTGARKEFTPAEIEGLRALQSQVKADEAERKEAKRQAQADRASAVLSAKEEKLAGFDDVKIYD